MVQLLLKRQGIPMASKYGPKDYHNQKTEITNERPKHPLVNPDSKHYQVTGDEAVTLMEKLYSTSELMSWSKITAMKYRLRIGKKDENNKELIKIGTYEDYYEYLDKLPSTTVEDKIVKILRTKEPDYAKIINICQEELRKGIR